MANIIDRNQKMMLVMFREISKNEKDWQYELFWISDEYDVVNNKIICSSEEKIYDITRRFKDFECIYFEECYISVNLSVKVGQTRI
jgi:hypothetical protein